MSNWKEVRRKLNISQNGEMEIELEKDRLRSLINIQCGQGLSPAEFDEKSRLKQSITNRTEKVVRSPQINDTL